MWAEIAQTLPSYCSAVLTGVDANGYPFSIRCRPQIDQSRQRILVDIAPTLPFEPGPASLLCHSHNEELWDLRSFLLRGRLESVDGAWIFRPAKIFDGELAGMIERLKLLRQVRKSTRRYLERRGLPRPKIPWEDYERLWAKTKQA